MLEAQQCAAAGRLLQRIVNLAGGGDGGMWPSPDLTRKLLRLYCSTAQALQWVSLNL